MCHLCDGLQGEGLFAWKKHAKGAISLRDPSECNAEKTGRVVTQIGLGKSSLEQSAQLAVQKDRATGPTMRRKVNSGEGCC